MRELVPSAADIRIEQRPRGCPQARAQAAARAIEALKKVEPAPRTDTS